MDSALRLITATLYSAAEHDVPVDRLQQMPHHCEGHLTHLMGVFLRLPC